MAIGQKVALDVNAWMLENLQRSFGWIGDPFVGKPWHNIERYDRRRQRQNNEERKCQKPNFMKL